MIIVNSSVEIDYFNGQVNPYIHKLDEVLGLEPVAISDLILVEVLQGFRSDQDYNTAKNLFNSLDIFNLLDTKLAIKGADNYRYLRKKGITVRKKADIIIATFCIESQIPLLFSDKDFKPFVKYLSLQSVL